MSGWTIAAVLTVAAIGAFPFALPRLIEKYVADELARLGTRDDDQ